MKIQDLNGKTVCLIGYAREGKSMHAALAKYAPDAKVTIADRDESVMAEGATLKLGPDYMEGLDSFDVVIRSIGIAYTPAMDTIAHKITDMTRIFFDTIQDSGVRTIGITGSKGKSTTTTLIYEALKAHDPNTHLMGNIGIPMIDFLAEAKPGATFVIELSSFMLEHLRRSPHVAVVTSFFPEHLDRHGDVQSYWATKKNIALHQTAEDAIFYNARYPQCKEIADASPGTRVGFSAEDFPLQVSETKFKGEHNRSNLAAAFKVATYLGVPEDVALTALKQADPLPHRLQNIGEHGSVVWVNDSFATAPEATIAALEALKDDVDTLLVGGFDRGVDYSGLAEYLDASPVQNIAFFPDTGTHIKAAMLSQKNTLETADMQEAVAWAAKVTAPGKTALLSSASPSFNLFKDFVVRGEAFVTAVQELDKK
jgi:UDP-N-acetylmuramoyl-L-alanine---L-glutamate ligase